MWSKGLFVVLLVLSAVLKASEGCSCLPAHPQNHFCTADFVILARIKRVVAHEHTKIYKVKIKREFKMSEKAHTALKSGKLHTPLHDSMCGVHLYLNQTYVITGRVYGLQAHIGLCGLSKLWSTVGHRQRKGFKLLFGKGCNCKFQSTICRSPSCISRNNDTCPWNYNSQCQTDHGICLQNPKGKCFWSKSLALKKCLYEGQKKDTALETFGPDPLKMPERPKEFTEEPVRTEPSRYHRVGYYRYNKINRAPN